jgi:hypothetical protein
MCHSGSIPYTNYPGNKKMELNNITPPSFAQSLSAQIESNRQHEPEMEVWEPPFERWIRLADALLEEKSNFLNYAPDYSPWPRRAGM